MKNRVALAGLVPMLVAGGALFWLSVRPCEPVAQASEPVVVGSVWIGETTVTPAPPEVDVESLPRVPQASARPMAHPTKKHQGCEKTTPYWQTNGWRPLDSTEGGFVQFWYCK
jgi:hypothetical protein